MVTGWEGGVHLHFTHFLSFHSSTLRSVSSLLHRKSKEGLKRKIFSSFLSFFLKKKKKKRGTFPVSYRGLEWLDNLIG